MRAGLPGRATSCLDVPYLSGRVLELGAASFGEHASDYRYLGDECSIQRGTFRYCPVLAWRHSEPFFEDAAEMRGAIETPGKADIGDRSMRLGGIAQSSGAVAEPAHPEVVRDRAGRITFESAMNAADRHPTSLRDRLHGQIRIREMPFDVGLDAGARHIPVHARGRRLDLLADRAPGHLGKRALQALSAGSTQAVHLVEGLGQRGLQDARQPCVGSPAASRSLLEQSEPFWIARALCENSATIKEARSTKNACKVSNSR